MSGWEDWSTPVDGKWIFTTENGELVDVVEAGGPGGRWYVTAVAEYNDSGALPAMSTADLKDFSGGLHSLSTYGSIVWAVDRRPSGAGYI